MKTMIPMNHTERFDADPNVKDHIYSRFEIAMARIWERHVMCAKSRDLARAGSCEKAFEDGLAVAYFEAYDILRDIYHMLYYVIPESAEDWEEKEAALKLKKEREKDEK